MAQNSIFETYSAGTEAEIEHIVAGDPEAARGLNKRALAEAGILIGSQLILPGSFLVRPLTLDLTTRVLGSAVKTGVNAYRAFASGEPISGELYAPISQQPGFIGSMRGAVSSAKRVGDHVRDYVKNQLKVEE